MLDRRAFLLSAGVASIFRPRGAFAAEPLTLWGPPAAPSIILAQAVASGALKDITPSAVFKTWRTPDEMRAGLSSGTMQAVIVPSNVAANLYNRGLGVHLLNIMTRGLLYVVAGDKLAKVEDLAGKKIAVPFRNDMPDFVLRRLLARVGLKPGTDVQFDYAGTPPEAMQMLLAGRVDAALLAEPAVTAAILPEGMGGDRRRQRLHPPGRPRGHPAIHRQGRSERTQDTSKCLAGCGGFCRRPSLSCICCFRHRIGFDEPDCRGSDSNQ
jgi:NitT/TauT family transport system substrate-binding protein